MRSIYLLIFLLSVAGSAVAQDAPPVAPNMETIPQGSFVIAMDKDKQSLDYIDIDFFIQYTGFNLGAYGLVHNLLQEQVPVKWVIRSGKFRDDPDFTANVSQIYPDAEEPATITFRTSAFVIDLNELVNTSCSEETTQSLDRIHTIIQDFDRDVAVYRLNEEVDMDVRYKLSHPPKVAILDDGTSTDVHSKILYEAGIPHDTLNSTTFFEEMSCYTFISQPHLDVINNPNYVNGLNDFLANGGNFLAQCISAYTFENAGKYLSTLGFSTDHAFDNFGYFYHNNDMPIMQFDGLAMRQIEGSLTNFNLAPGSSWRQDSYVGLTNQQNEYVIVAGDTNGNFPGGNVFYLSGHEYSMLDFETYLLSNGGAPSTIDLQRVQQLKRTYLNAIFVPAAINFACAGNDVCICPGESVTLGCPELLDNPSIIYEWTPSDGLSCTDCPHPVANPVTTTTYSLSISTGLGTECVEVSETTIRVNDGPSVENFTETCDAEGLSYTITFSISGGDPDSYDVQGVAGTLDGNSFTSDPILSNEIYEITVADDNECDFILTGQRNCCLAEAVISGGGEICSEFGETAELILEFSGEGPWEVEYEIDGLAQPLIVASENPFVLESDIPGLYSLVTVSDSNCEGFVFGEAEVEVHSVPEISLDSQNEICPGSSLLLDASFEGASYLWQDGSTESSFLVESEGYYSVTLTNGCGVISESVEILASVKDPIADLGEDRAICRDSILRFDLQQNSSQFLWQDGSTSPVFTVNAPGVYSVTVTNNCGEATSSVSIQEFNCTDCLVYVPNAFSPNYDGINDEFKLYSNDCLFESFSLSVFDRWGQLVYQSNSSSNGWTGLKDGRNFPMGVYVWLVEYEINYKGERLFERVSGDVTLLR